LRQLHLLYFCLIQVIHLVELFELYDLVVTLVKLAIDMAEPDDPNVVSICRIYFSILIVKVQKYNTMKPVILYEWISTASGSLHTAFGTV
jgi:hypothetical protein